MARIGIILAGLVLLSSHPIIAGQSVTFGWDPNTEPDVAGYRIYYGVASRAYSQVVDTGNATRATISNLVAGTTYYFAITAYNSLGLEGEYSGEIGYTVPVTFAALQLTMTPTTQAVLRVTGPAARTYNIQATADLKNWTNIGAVTLSAGGLSTFTDTNAVKQPKRFYRAQAVGP